MYVHVHVFVCGYVRAHVLVCLSSLVLQRVVIHYVICSYVKQHNIHLFIF